MGLIVVAVVCAAAVGRLLGGRLGALEGLPLRGWQLLANALALQVVAAVAVSAGVPAGPMQVVAHTAAGVLALVFSLRNSAVHGVLLVGAGLLLNALVIAVNGAMPVSAHAAQRAGLPAGAVEEDARAEPASGATRLRTLGDVVPVPLPAHPEVASVGDLFVTAGLAQFVLSGMLHGRRTLWGARLPGGGVPLAPRAQGPTPDRFDEFGDFDRFDGFDGRPGGEPPAAPPGRHRAPDDRLAAEGVFEPELDSQLVRIIAGPKPARQDAPPADQH